MGTEPATLKPNILSKIDKFVKEEIDKGVIPKDAKLAVIGTVDNEGFTVLAAVNIKPDTDNKINVQVQAIWDHDWDGSDSAAAKVIFSR